VPRREDKRVRRAESEECLAGQDSRKEQFNQSWLKLRKNLAERKRRQEGPSSGIGGKPSRTRLKRGAVQSKLAETTERKRRQGGRRAKSEESLAKLEQDKTPERSSSIKAG
jgi:hypothetical protein